ncbi:hypothetical protein GCK32_020958, partial [Trichostrongylus colubriformis]
YPSNLFGPGFQVFDRCSKFRIASITGEEPGPKILPDSEYPPWLFELDLRPPRPLEDLDPEKDGWLYWRALRIRQIEQNRRIEKLKTRFLHLQNSPSMKKFSKF